jgi:hypothetical protein
MLRPLYDNVRKIDFIAKITDNSSVYINMPIAAYWNCKMRFACRNFKLNSTSSLERRYYTSLNLQFTKCKTRTKLTKRLPSVHNIAYQRHFQHLKWQRKKNNKIMSKSRCLLIWQPWADLINTANMSDQQLYY